MRNSCADGVFSQTVEQNNEGAIKLARLYYKKKGFPNRFEIITLDKSFHGRTATIAATGQEKYQKDYSVNTEVSESAHQRLEALENTICDNLCHFA